MMEYTYTIPVPEPYSFMRAVFASGRSAFFGWLVLFLVPLSAVIVSIRHIANPESHVRGSRFFEITHVCLLWFMCQVGVLGNVQGFLHQHLPFCGCGQCAAPETLISFGIGLLIVTLSSVLVCLVLRRKPDLDAWACLGLIAATIGVLFATGTMAFFRW